MSEDGDFGWLYQAVVEHSPPLPDVSTEEICAAIEMKFEGMMETQKDLLRDICRDGKSAQEVAAELNGDDGEEFGVSAETIQFQLETYVMQIYDAMKDAVS